MTSSLEETALRFFSMVGLAEPSGYRTIEVLLEDSVRAYFGGRDHLLLTFFTDVARENPEAQLLSYGSPLLESITEASFALGDVSRFYLGGVGLSRGRTLEKVWQESRVPGRVIEAGEKQPYNFHHGLFRFKVSLVADVNEEAFYDVGVDLHSGWTTMKLGYDALRIHSSDRLEVFPETNVELGLNDACNRALEDLQTAIVPWVRRRELSQVSAVRVEKLQVAQHYETMVETLEAASPGREPTWRG